MSGQYFDFDGLIEAYSTTFTVITFSEAGYNDAGDWQDGQEQRQTFTGAIISFKENKVFRSEGAITAKDKRLFMLQALPDALIGAHVVRDGQKYMIESELENAKYTGVYSYLLRWVSAFGKGGNANA